MWDAAARIRIHIRLALIETRLALLEKSHDRTHQKQHVDRGRHGDCHNLLCSSTGRGRHEDCCNWLWSSTGDPSLSSTADCNSPHAALCTHTALCSALPSGSMTVLIRSSMWAVDGIETVAIGCKASGPSTVELHGRLQQSPCRPLLTYTAAFLQCTVSLNEEGKMEDLSPCHILHAITLLGHCAPR